MESNPLHQLIEGCRQQDRKSQEQIYRLFYPDMIKICFRYANDSDGAGIIYNNAMLKVFRNIASYTEEGKSEGWIKRIVINCCIDFYKAKTVFRNIESSYKEDIFIEPEIFQQITDKEIQQLIKALPRATAAVFMLFIYDGFTHKQIAERLEISENTSKWHVSEAKLKLRTDLANMHDLKTEIHALR